MSSSSHQVRGVPCAFSPRICVVSSKAILRELFIYERLGPRAAPTVPLAVESFVVDLLCGGARTESPLCAFVWGKRKTAAFARCVNKNDCQLALCRYVVLTCYCAGTGKCFYFRGGDSDVVYFCWFYRMCLSLIHI